jgi:segregation and condensation protein A
MDYKLRVEDFEGPLDLLLFLISEKKINIIEVSISEITEQYINHIKKWQSMDLEIASDFIVMASRLLEMKSKLILPIDSDEENQEDLHKKFLSNLIYYKIFKVCSVYIGEKVNHLNNFYKDPEYIPEIMDAGDEEVYINSIELELKFLRLLKLRELEDKHWSKPIEVPLERFSVQEKIDYISKKLENQKYLRFSELFTDKPCQEEVVTSLLALLELYKVNEIIINQENNFGEIQVFKKDI